MFSRSKSTVIVISVAVVVVVLNVALAEAATKVYLCAGQSNMVGWQSYNTELPPELQQLQPDVQIYVAGHAHSSYTNRWMTLQPGLGADSNRFGPELTFGRDLAEAMPGDDIMLIKYSIGGSTLWNDWRAPDGPLYTTFMNTISNARASLGLHELAGMIWMQGEYDAWPGSASSSDADAYGDNLTNFIQHIRADLMMPDLPFVIGQISESWAWTWGDIVRQCQYEVSQSVANTALVVTSDLGMSIDTVHYSEAGIIELGSRFADAIVSIPEPATLMSLAGGVVSVLLGRRRIA